MVLPRSLWDFVRSFGDEGGFAELRGWRFEFVSARFNVRPSVSDLSSICPTRRDVFLRRVYSLRIESEAMLFGRLVHEAFLYPIRGILRGLDVESVIARFRGYIRSAPVRYRRILWNVFEKGLEHAIVAKVDGLPISIEPLIPASPIGLSDYVKPDLLVGFIPVEITTSTNNERKEVSLTAYAMAIEAWTGHPVDYAVLTHITINGGVRINWRVVRVNDSLRRRFLDIRDSIAKMIEYNQDPGIAEECPSSCPFIEVCKGGGLPSGAGIKGTR